MSTYSQSSVNTLQERIDQLEDLKNILKPLSKPQEKSELLEHLPTVVQFLKQTPWLNNFLFKSTPEQRYALYAVIAIGEGPIVLRGHDQIQNLTAALHHLTAGLVQVETFYSSVGGIIGYQLMILKLIRGDTLAPFQQDDQTRYRKPSWIDLRANTGLVRFSTIEGIRRLPEMAEMYPVGGAGDRLNLFEEATGAPLPAALLPFGTGCLFDELVRDLQAREYLHFKLFDKQVITPIVLMTSKEKNNERHINQLLKDRFWYGRGQDKFFIFVQPRVPVVTEKGHWSMTGPFEPLYKPGGHGPIWKLALDSGALSWLHERGIRKMLVRQINNPIAGVDGGLLAFAGLGLTQNKRFGFASCERLINAPEGMIVLVEARSEEGFTYCMTNIEYTEFAKHGLKDVPKEPSSLYSAFPANTNILFVDIETLKRAIEVCPLPGMLINMKTKTPFIDSEGNRTEEPAGRLEGTMQNIADYIVDRFDRQLDEGNQQIEALSTYLTFNERHKTLSVTKNLFKPDSSPLGTPESCFYDFMVDYHELFVNHCRMNIPDMPPLETFMNQAPPYVIQIHPALGPLYTIISQKIQGGSLTMGAHLILEIAELEIQQLFLNGSLQILADCPMGQNGRYGQDTGKCTLRHIQITNHGLDYSQTKQYWNSTIKCQESLKIRLRGNGEFFAENVHFNGAHCIEVANGEKVTAYTNNAGEVSFHREELSASSWHWQYSINDNNEIILARKSHPH